MPVLRLIVPLLLKVPFENTAALAVAFKVAPEIRLTVALPELVKLLPLQVLVPRIFHVKLLEITRPPVAVGEKVPPPFELRVAPVPERVPRVQVNKPDKVTVRVFPILKVPLF